MRITNFRLLTVLLAVITLVFVPSCKDDDEKTISTTTPVLNENFFVTNSDANTFVFTTTLAASNMWITNCATEVASDFVDNACTLSLYIKGDYKLVCGALVDGVEYVSDTFSVNVASTNTTFLNTGLWHALTGGPTGGKVWKLDLSSITTTTIDDAGVSSSSSKYASSFFYNAQDYYSDFEADNVWGPFGGSNIYDWGGAPEIGTISFDGTTGLATLILTDGVWADGDGANLTTTTATDGTVTYKANPTSRIGTYTGAFAMVVSDRVADFCTISAKNNNGVEASLWDYMLAGSYKCLGSLSDQTGKMIFTGDMRFPMEKGRVGEGEFLASDLKNVMIMHCDDSSLVVRVKRTYEGFTDATTHKSSLCYILYNYIAEGYNYTPTVYHNTDVVNSSATASTLVGTWKFAPLTGEWVNWGTKNTYGSYTAATEASTFAGWGDTYTTEKYASALKSSYTFNSNGTYSFTDVLYNTTSLAEETTTYTGTYTVNNGYVTLSATANITAFNGRLQLTGTHIYVISTPANGTSGSLWLGQNNGTKSESTAVQLVKQ